MTPMINFLQNPEAATRGRFVDAFRAMLTTLALVGVIWSVSSWGYYALVGAMSLDSGYDDAPLIFAGYYLVWTIIVLLAFRPVFEGRLSRPALSGHAMALAPILAAYGVFVAVALPLLPASRRYAGCGGAAGSLRRYGSYSAGMGPVSAFTSGIGSDYRRLHERDGARDDPAYRS